MLTYEWLNREKARFYKITIIKDHPTNIKLNYQWGGCNSNRGGRKSIIVGSDEEVQTCISKMKSRRRQRGYEML